MEPWARKGNCCRFLLVSLSWSTILLSPWPIVSPHAEANAQTATEATPSNVDQIYKRLRDLELKILGKPHDSDLVTARLERLEEKVFGVKRTGELRRRLDALLVASEAFSENPASDVNNNIGQEKSAAVPLSMQSAKASSIQDTDAPAPSRASAYAPKIDMVTPNVPPPPEPTPEPKAKTQRQIDVDYGPWLRDLERRLKRAWFPPKMTGEKKVARITFVVSKDGLMSKLRMLESSGAALCDQAALKAAEIGSPFRPLPAGSVDEVPIFVSFSYDGTAGTWNACLNSSGTKVTASTKDDRTLAESRPEIFDALKRSLEELWRPNPSSTKRICELQFWTDSTNTEEVKVAKSSGDAGFDEQARRAVKALLPISVPKSSYTLLRGRFGSDRSIVVCAEDEADFGPYMAAIQRKIKGNWHPPKGDETRRVNIVFKLLQDGTIKNPFVKDSTGAETADAAGLAAVTASSPLPALPANSPNEVDIQFTLDYNVFKSASDAPGTFRKFPESSQSTFEVTQEDVNLLKEALKSSKQLDIPQDRPYLPGVLPF